MNSQIHHFSEINISTLISVLAIILSLVSIYYSNKTYHDTAASIVIRQNYQDFLDLHMIRAENPLQSHVFVSAYEYDAVKLTVTKATRNDAPKEKVVHLLTEYALSRRIFTMYEASYFQWKNAKAHSDKARQVFLTLVLDYFTRTLLRNPRLLWYWAQDGGNEKIHYEPEVTEYYEEHVTRELNKAMVVDGVGPYN